MPHWLAALAGLQPWLDALPAAGLPPTLHAARHVLWGGLTFQIYAALGDLRIPDALARGPATAAQVAAGLGEGACADATFRVLRAAVQTNLLDSDAGWLLDGEDASPMTTRFKNNQASALLRTDHPCSLAPLAALLADVAPASARLAWVLRTGGDAYAAAHGAPLFERLAADPGAAAAFGAAMGCHEFVGGAEVLADYPWAGRGFRRFIDVAGGPGTFLARLLAACPKAGGVLFDVPAVVEAAAADWAADPGRAALLPRTAFVGGDMFDAPSLPALASGDALVYRMALHDWGDATAAAALRAARARAGGLDVTLVLVEAVLPPGVKDQTYRRGLVDVLILCGTGQGRERTATAWRRLLASADWALARVVRTRGVFAVVEAVPA